MTLWTERRVVQSEWLDELPPDDPSAVTSRHDLRWINACMLQNGIMARSLAGFWGRGTPRLLIDLGSGDGTFVLSVARRLAQRWRGVTVVLVDRQDIVSQQTRQAFQSLGWHAEPVAADAVEFLERKHNADIILANLFLHHFACEPLARLLEAAAARSQLFVACEPRRAQRALLASKLLWTIGCNTVSRHDASVSVRAGFTGREISSRWPNDPAWVLYEEPARLFTHCFAARRIAGGI